MNIKKNPLELKLFEKGDCQFGLTNKGAGFVWEPNKKESKNKLFKDSLVRLSIERTLKGDNNMQVLFKKKF